MTSPPNPAQAIVEAHDVTRVFHGDEAVVAIEGVSLAIAPGEFVALEGPSGCGKSTMLHLLGGLDLPTAGTVHFDGHDYAAMDDTGRSELRRLRMGMVLPVVQLIDSLTVWENVAIALLLGGGRLADGRARACHLLDQVGLGRRHNAYAARLSAGEAQRAALSRALFNQPALLLLDEPTSSLDSVRADDILTLLRDLADHGQAIAMATHNARAAAFADRSIHLRDGRLVEP